MNEEVDLELLGDASYNDDFDQGNLGQGDANEGFDHDINQDLWI